MPTLNKEDSKEPPLAGEEVHAPVVVTMEIESGDESTRSSATSGMDDYNTLTSSTATNESSFDTKSGNANVDEKVSGRGDVMEESEERVEGGRDISSTCTTKKSSTNKGESNISVSEDSHVNSNDETKDGEAFDFLEKTNNEVDDADEYAEKAGDKYEEISALGKPESVSLDQSDAIDYQPTGQYNMTFVSSRSQSNESAVRSSRNEKQDEYVKKGARVKALLASALQAVADGIAARVEDSAMMNNDGDDTDKEDKTGKTDDYVHVQELAQKKSEECITLKRKLEESQLQIQCLHDECSASEQKASQAQTKIDRTLEALKIAGANAANARAEADAANARAESLNKQLNDLQTVIDDTKSTMEVVRREHDEVSHAARSVESRLIQVESELTRAARVKRDAEEERDVLKARAEKSEKLVLVLQEKVNDFQDEVRHLKKDMIEMDELEKMRSARTQRVEVELQDARSGLLEATSAAAEAESTVTSLRSVIEELRRDNESLHFQIEESRNAVSKERTKQNDILTVAENDAQKWRLKCEECEEENRKLKMDKATAEKQVEQLKSRIVNLERRINDSSFKAGNTSASAMPKAPEKNAVVTPKNDTSDLGVISSFGSKEGLSETEGGSKRKYVSELPTREPSKSHADSYSRQLSYTTTKSRTEKENRLNKSDSSSRDSKRPKKVQSNICCLCNREGGMILRCQCDNINCDARAHPMCIGRFRLGKADSAKTILCSNA